MLTSLMRRSSAYQVTCWPSTSAGSAVRNTSLKACRTAARRKIGEGLRRQFQQYSALVLEEERIAVSDPVLGAQFQEDPPVFPGRRSFPEARPVRIA